MNVFAVLPVDSRFLSQLTKLVIGRAISGAKQLRVSSQCINVLAVFFQYPIQTIKPGASLDAFDIFAVLHGLLAGSAVGQGIPKVARGFIVGARSDDFLGSTAKAVIKVNDFGTVSILTRKLCPRK